LHFACKNKRKNKKKRKKHIKRKNKREKRKEKKVRSLQFLNFFLSSFFFFLLY